MGRHWDHNNIRKEQAARNANPNEVRFTDTAEAKDVQITRLRAEVGHLVNALEETEKRRQACADEVMELGRTLEKVRAGVVGPTYYGTGWVLGTIDMALAAHRERMKGGA